MKKKKMNGGARGERWTRKVCFAEGEKNYFFFWVKNYPLTLWLLTVDSQPSWAGLIEVFKEIVFLWARKTTTKKETLDFGV